MTDRPDWCDEETWATAVSLMECVGYQGPQEFAEIAARDLLAAGEPFRSALRTIQSAVPGYLKGETTEHDFALLVLGEVDNGKVNKALEKGR